MREHRADHVVEHVDVERQVSEPLLDILLVPNRRQKESSYENQSTRKLLVCGYE